MTGLLTFEQIRRQASKFEATRITAADTVPLAGWIADLAGRSASLLQRVEELEKQVERLRASQK